MKYLLTMFCAILVMASCGDDDVVVTGAADQKEDTKMPPVPQMADRTVMVYMSAENNLSYDATDDMREMQAGSKVLPENTNLILFVDQADRSTPPYVKRICKGMEETDKTITFDEDFYACAPNKMLDVLTRMMQRYPARSYGLVLWGHAGGWLIEKDTIDVNTATSQPRKAYGVDTGVDLPKMDGNKWINIPTLATVLGNLPHKLHFIFADCCNFQCVETAYELRDVTDYIIGSPAETPTVGAPYDKILPYMFSQKEDFYKGIVDEYNSMIVNSYEQVPMSAVRTDAMENLAEATRPLFGLLFEMDRIDTRELIYYRGGRGVKIMTDMNDLMMRNITDTEVYDKWKSAFDEAVTYRAKSACWLTDGYVTFDFSVTDERYGGVSMFVPQPIYDTKGFTYNADFSMMSWCHAAGADAYYTEE